MIKKLYSRIFTTIISLVVILSFVFIAKPVKAANGCGFRIVFDATPRTIRLDQPLNLYMQVTAGDNAGVGSCNTSAGTVVVAINDEVHYLWNFSFKNDSNRWPTEKTVQTKTVQVPIPKRLQTLQVLSATLYAGVVRGTLGQSYMGTDALNLSFDTKSNSIKVTFDKNAPDTPALGGGGGNQVTTLYGCKAKDGSGIYACYDTVAKAVAAGCPAPVQTIDKAWCGKTDEQIQAAGGGTPGGDTSGAGKVDISLTETLFNPLPLDSLTGVLLYIVRGFLAIVALWAVAFIIFGGFKMVMAQGNEEAYLAAKKTITWAIIGLVIAMLSFSIIAIVQNLIGVTVLVPPT